MSGMHLARIGRRLLRRDTYEAIVAPAIADLQYEERLGAWPRMRGYAGVWRAVGAAVSGEIAQDCLETLRAVDVREAWSPIAATALLTALLHGHILWALGRGPLPWHHTVVLLALWVPTLLALMAPPVALPIAAILARTRRRGARRAGVLLAAAIVGMVVIGSQRIAANVQSLQRDLFLSSSWAHRDGYRNQPLWTLREMHRPQLADFTARERAASLRYERSRSEPPRFAAIFNRQTALAFSCLSFALIGAVYATRPTWLLTLLAGLVFLAHAATTYLFQQVLYVQAVTGWPSAFGAPVALVFLVCAWIVVRRRDAGGPT